MRGISYNPVASRFIYAYCDDWFIFARERSTGRLFYVCTELWTDWLEIPEEEVDRCQQLQMTGDGPGPVEKFMLPLAMKKWRLLNWAPCIRKYDKAFCSGCTDSKCLEYMKKLGVPNEPS